MWLIDKLSPMYRYYEMGEELDVCRVENFGITWIFVRPISIIDMMVSAVIGAMLYSIVEDILKKDSKEVTIWQKD